MDIAEYREAVVEGFRSIVRAALKWRDNPLTGEVNRRLWGPVPWLTLGMLAVVTVGFSLLLPSLDVVIGFVPPLMALAFVPNTVRDLVWSAPAVFGFVVAWRVHRLRATAAEDWPDRRCRADFGVRFFEAGALPVAVACLVMVVGIELAGGFVSPVEPAAEDAVGMSDSVWNMSFSSNRLAGNLVVSVLVAGLMGVYRKVGQGIGKLFGAGFFIWGVHLGIAFAAPWMVGWVSYLPLIGPHVPQRSVDGIHMLFDVAVALSVWTVVREKSRTAPLWSDVPPPPPPEDETAAEDGGSEQRQQAAAANSGSGRKQ